MVYSTDRGERYVKGEKLGETGRELRLPKSNQLHVAFILFYILMLSSIDSLGGNYLKHWQGHRL